MVQFSILKILNGVIAGYMYMLLEVRCTLNLIQTFFSFDLGVIFFVPIVMVLLVLSLQPPLILTMPHQLIKL